MRRASYALTTALLVSGHSHAAEPSAPKPPAPAATASKPTATPTPAPTPPAPPAPAASPGPAPAAPKPAPTPPAPASAPPGATPPPEYYIEPGFPAQGPNAVPAPGSGGPPQTAGGPPGPPPPPPQGMPIYEPPPPGFYPGVAVFEPPPPPEPRHLAPRTALLLGARVGWFIPFGDVWARRTAGGGVYGVGWSDYSSSGPMFELNAGARLSRYYSVFALWERAWLGDGNGGSGSDNLHGKADHGDTDFWGAGVRASTNPDGLGFITELAIGYRRARAIYDSGDEIQFTNAPFETRLGLGADFRLNRVVTLSALATIGFGQFGTIESVNHAGIHDETR